MPDASASPAPADTPAPTGVWVVLLPNQSDGPGLIADAREIADALGGALYVLDFVGQSPTDAGRSQEWIERGADHVQRVFGGGASQRDQLDVCDHMRRDRCPRLVFCTADRSGRAFAARLAARHCWRLTSPALLVRKCGTGLLATQLDASGRWARTVALADGTPAVVAVQPGVAQPMSRDATRRGTIASEALASTPVSSRTVERLPADARTADIRHLRKLVAGGRGVGGRAGFERLRRVAAKLDAGVAASRMAVDLGWIEPERQVGQTGRCVSPDLYVACGISGASHHLDGMSESRCIVAINTDPAAPLFERAHVAVAGDLHAVLQHLEHELERIA